MRTTGSNKNIGGSHAARAPELLPRNNHAFPVDLKIFPHSVLPLAVPASFPSPAYTLHKVPSSPEVITEILHLTPLQKEAFRPLF